MNMLADWKNELKEQNKRRAKRKKIVDLIDVTAPDKWVFPQHNGSVGHPHSLTTFLRRFCADNGIVNISPHTLRHMSGSYLLRANCGVWKALRDKG